MIRFYLSMMPGVFALLAGWALVAAAIGDANQLPGPDYVLAHTLPSLALMAGEEPDAGVGMAELLRHLRATLLRVVLGLILGIVAGGGIGLAMGSVSRRRGHGAGATTPLTVLKNVPLFALIPLFIYWFSGTSESLILYVAMCTALLFAPATAEAVHRVHPAVLGLTRMQRVAPVTMAVSVLLPAIWPHIAPTMRWLVGLSWAFSLGAEFSGSPAYGLGVICHAAYIWSDTGRLLLVAAVYLGAGLVSIMLLDLVLGLLTRFTWFRCSPSLGGHPL